jgi:PAS domain S-box-containing protein
MNPNLPPPGPQADALDERSCRMLIEELPAMVCRFRSDGMITFANRAYCSLFGQRGESLLGSNFYETVASQQDALLGHCVTLATDSPDLTQEFQVMVPGNRTCWLRWKFRGLSDDRGAVGEYLAIGEDITAQKLAEDEIAQMTNTQKMEAVARLAGGIAHDFNNILGGIIGYSDVLAMKLTGSPDLMEYSQKILRSAGKASELVKQLLAFSRKTAIELESCDIHQIITRVITQLEPCSLPQIRIQTDFARQSTVVLGDSELLENMLYNIAINGVEAMPRGGTLSFSTSCERDGSASRCSAGDCSNGSLRITIADTGVGIDDETAKHIFEPFFTTKGRGKGTGLGLSTAWGIARQHRGCITVDTAVGKGTAFSVCLPIEHQQTRQEQ